MISKYRIDAIKMLKKNKKNIKHIVINDKLSTVGFFYSFSKICLIYIMQKSIINHQHSYIGIF